MWKQTRIALNFYEQHLHYWEMENANELLSNEEAFCFAKPNEVYAIYVKRGSTKINLENAQGQYLVQWYNPRTGDFRKGGLEIAEGGQQVDLGSPPNEPLRDWTILLTKR